MKRIQACRVCGAKGPVEFFDLGKQPFANALLKKANEAEKAYPLSLSFCKKCTLVQLNHTASPKELFSNYVWVTGTSSTARAYAEGFASALLKISKVKRGARVLEAASNDGTFLKVFQDRGMQVQGVDPAKNIATMATKRGVPTQAAFFGETLAKNLIKDGAFDIVFARNVVPHVADPRDFVKGLRVAAGAKGIVAIEVHHAERILAENHYDSIYHEHLCYFSLRALEALLSGAGLHAFDLARSPISGGSVVVYASAKRKPAHKRLRDARAQEKEAGTLDLKAWQKFAARALEHRKLLRAGVAGLVERGQRVIGYGASARSSTLLNFCGIDRSMIAAIADQNPLKHGRFTPGTRIPIVSPAVAFKKLPDVVFLLAWNFAEEIIQTLEAKYAGRLGYILPLPVPTILYADDSEEPRKKGKKRHD